MGIGGRPLRRIRKANIFISLETLFAQVIFMAVRMAIPSVAFRSSVRGK